MTAPAAVASPSAKLMSKPVMSVPLASVKRGMVSSVSVESVTPSVVRLKWNVSAGLTVPSFTSR